MPARLVPVGCGIAFVLTAWGQAVSKGVACVRKLYFLSGFLKL